MIHIFKLKPQKRAYKRIIPIERKALYQPRFRERYLEEDYEVANTIRRRNALREFLYNGA